MPQRMMEQSKIFQLEKLLSYCRQLDFLKIRYFPGLVCYCFDPFSTLVYAV